MNAGPWRFCLCSGLLGSALIASTCLADQVLLIGIDAYPHVRPLQGSVNDVRHMQTFLMEDLGIPGGQIHTLLDAEATRSNILAALEQLVGRSNPGERVIFHYSGHGYFQPDENGDESDGVDETLVPVDTRPLEGGRYAGMISDDELDLAFAKLADRDVHIILDSCHAGTATRTLQKPPPHSKSLRGETQAITRSLRGLVPTAAGGAVVEANAERVVWTAVNAEQDALWEPSANPPGGVFTNRFLAGLRDRQADRNGDGEVSYRELLGFVQDTSAAYCRKVGRRFCRRGLSPTLTGAEQRLDASVFGRGIRVDAAAEERSEGQQLRDLLANARAFDVSLEMLPGTTLGVGEVMQFRVHSAQDGELLLIDVDAAGNLGQVFPNDTCGRVQLRAGQPVTVPDLYQACEFRAREPAGAGVLIAVVSREGLRLDDLRDLRRGITVTAVEDAVTPSAGETGGLSARQDDGKPAAVRQWGSATVEYTIRR